MNSLLKNFAEKQKIEVHDNEECYELFVGEDIDNIELLNDKLKSVFAYAVTSSDDSKSIMLIENSEDSEDFCYCIIDNATGEKQYFNKNI